MKRFRGQRYVPLVTRGSLAQLADVPICGFVGYNGMGKSLAAVAAAMVHLERGRPVLSTVRLLDYNDPRPCEDPGCLSTRHGDPDHLAAHPLWRPLYDFRQLFDFRGGHVLLDEVTGVADAREHAAMPVQVANYLPQLRRRDVTLAWTTIGWGFADVRIRRLTLAAVYAVGTAGVRVPGSMWPSNRLFLWRTYDARDFDEFDAKKREDIRCRNRQVFWRPGSLVERAYDTRDGVLALGAANDAGMCLHCGGKRSMPRCSCVAVADDVTGSDGPAGRPERRTARKREARGRTAAPVALADGPPGPP